MTMSGAGAKPFVDAKIAQRKVMMFSKRYSPDCKFVRNILDGFNMTPEVFEIVEIESRQDCSQIQNYFQTLCLTDSREVPQVFINGSYLGGQKVIYRLSESGELHKILQDAGAIS